ncbi:MAG: nucleoside recognition protein [Lachnospiraceae bacterium]|nr:nucleoside recognition protein [Lachnospiraceae bacterium]
MLNILWAAMILVGIVWGMASGQTQAVSSAIIDSGKDAVSLCITMFGVVGMWCGMMEIAKDSGLVETLTAVIRPFIRFLFPNLPKNHPAEESISLNIIANFLGLGWAATPAGLQAMENLAQLEKERGNEAYLDQTGSRVRAASNEMCVFLIMNISSLQLIPVNMIAYRSQYQSANPAVIVGPAILATMVSSAAAVVFCKGMDRRK